MSLACTLMPVNTHDTKCLSGVQVLLAMLHMWCTGMASETNLFCSYLFSICTIDEMCGMH